MNTIFSFLPFSYCAQPKVAVHYSCEAKKYSFDSTIVGHILVFGGAKNSNIALTLWCAFFGTPYSQVCSLLTSHLTVVYLH